MASNLNGDNIPSGWTTGKTTALYTQKKLEEQTEKLQGITEQKLELLKDNSQLDSVSFTQQTEDGFVVNDLASQKNEAHELAEQLKESGADLKQIVSTFISKSSQAAEILDAVKSELDGEVSYVEENQALAETTAQEAVEEQQVVEEMSEQAQEEIKAKQEELEELNAKIESGEATEEEQLRARDLDDEIQHLSDKSSDDIKAKQGDVEKANANATAVSEKMLSVAQKVGKAVNLANDAKELSTETQSLGKELYDKGVKEKNKKKSFWGKIKSACKNFVNKNIRTVVVGAITGSAGVAIPGVGLFSGFAIGSLGKIATDLFKGKAEDTVKDLGKNALDSVGLGSLLDSGSSSNSKAGSKIDVGKNAMNLATTLNAKIADTKNVAETVAKQNNITISAHENAKTSITDLDAAIQSSGEKISDVASNTPDVAHKPLGLSFNYVDTSNQTEENEESGENNQLSLNTQFDELQVEKKRTSSRFFN